MRFMYSANPRSLEKLLRALSLQVLYVASERLLIEQVDSSTEHPDRA